MAGGEQTVMEGDGRGAAPQRHVGSSQQPPFSRIVPRSLGPFAQGEYGRWLVSSRAGHMFTAPL